MRWLKSILGLVAVVAVVTLAWESRQMRRELARLTELVSAQPPTPAPGTPPVAANASTEPHAGGDYVIEPPDIVAIDFRTTGDADPAGTNSVRGKHMVRPDGTVGLGVFGNVSVAGETVATAEALVRTNLAKYVAVQDVTVRVADFNSMSYHVITDHEAGGEEVVRRPCVGNEAVLDAVASSGPTQKLSAKEAQSLKVWVARPSQDRADQILPVDWVAITQHGEAGTNYQLRHGDRVYVKGAK